MSAPRQLGRYRIERPLGSGGMGVVYLARADDGLQVALKSLATGFDVELMARFKREAKLLAKLRHPGICGVVELVEQGPGAPFLVLEYVPGHTLTELARDDLPVQRAVDVLIQVCDAVEHAHAATVLHRDLKPSNVIVTPDDRAVVLDFGIARRAGDAESQALSHTGEVLGTPGFMPPEQALGEEITPRTDVYALGATLYAALTGEPPFRGRSALATLEAVLKTPPTPPSRIRADVPPALDAICLRAMSKDPAARYRSAAELGGALRTWGSAEGPTRGHAPRAALWIGLVVLLLAVAGVFALTNPTSSDPVTPVVGAAPVPTESHLPATEPATERPQSLAELELDLQTWLAYTEGVQEPALRPRDARPPQGARAVPAARARRESVARLRDREDPDRPELWVTGGRLQLAFGNYAAAVARARKALELDPAHGPAHLTLARALWRRGQWEFLNSWIDPNTKTAWTTEASRGLAEAAQLGVPIPRIDRARQATFKLLVRCRDRPRDPRVLDPLVRTHEATLRGLSGPEPLVLRALVLMVLDRNRILESYGLIERALELTPSSLLIRRLRGQLRARSPTSNVDTDLRFVLELRPNGFDLLLLSELYLNRMQLSQVDEILNDLDNATAASSLVSLIRAALAMRRGKHRVAGRLLNAALEGGIPSHIRPNANLLIAEFALHAGDYDRCRDHLVQVSRVPGAQRHVALYTWARYYHAQSRFQKALKAIDAHLRQQPVPNSLLVRGRVLSDQRRHAEGIRSHQAAVRHGQGHARFQCWLGMAQVDGGQVAAARSTFQVLARTHPRSLYASTLAAYIAIARMNGVLARRACDAAIAAGSGKSETWIAYLLRAKLRAQSNDFAGGIQDLTKSLELQAGQPNALELRAMLDRWRKEHP